MGKKRIQIFPFYPMAMKKACGLLLLMLASLKRASESCAAVISTFPYQISFCHFQMNIGTCRVPRILRQWIGVIFPGDFVKPNLRTEHETDRDSGKSKRLSLLPYRWHHEGGGTLIVTSSECGNTLSSQGLSSFDRLPSSFLDQRWISHVVDRMSWSDNFAVAWKNGYEITTHHKCVMYFITV